jgi:hypothetical protein
MRKRTLLIFGFVALTAGNALLCGKLTDERQRVRALLDDKRVLARRLTHVSEQEREQQARLQRLRRTIASEQDAPTSPDAQSEGAHAPVGSLDPLSREHRKTLALRTRGALLRELALTPEQRDAVLDAIVAQEYRSAQSMSDLRHDDEPNPEEQRATVNAQHRKYKEDVVAAIGQEKATQLEALERTQPALAEVKLVRESLDAAGLPIDEAQRSRLLSILTRPDFLSAPGPVVGDAEGSAAAAMQRWHHERTKRFQQEAASVLTPQQLTQLEAFQAADEALMELTRRMGGGTAYASGGTLLPTPASHD